MKKKGLCLLLSFLFVLGLISSAAAETYKNNGDWWVHFTANKKLESSFHNSDISALVSGIQPGDTIVLTVKLANQYSLSTDWYMTNKVIKSLEESVKNASGGAYGYDLRYTNSSGVETVLYSSNTVGGEKNTAAGVGMHEATNSLQNYFYLDTLGAYKSGTVVLTVSLDGETQGNSYQDTLADLQMNFAVELTGSTSEGPKTGDQMEMLPYYIAAAVSGLVLLVIALISVKKARSVGSRKAKK